jgi:flagellar protein FliO/FliZ
MIGEYLLRLLLLVPLVGALAWGSLWMWKRLQVGLPASGGEERLVRVLEILPIATGIKLTVVEFGGRHHLIAVTRTTVQPIASDDRGDFHVS